MKDSRTHSDLLRSLAAIILVMFSFSCTKTVHDRRPTTTDSPESREYFGFVLNGKHFISEARTHNVLGTCVFTTASTTAMTFNIKSSHLAPNCVGGTIEIILDSVEIREGDTYSFGTPGRRKNYLTCLFANQCSKPAKEFTTRDGSFGFIKIKKYRPDIKVIQAVFSCIVTNDQGITYQIADGYFDRHFTQE